MRRRLNLLGFRRSLSGNSGNRGPVRGRGGGYCQSVWVAGPGELGRIRGGRQEKPNFLAALGVVIVLINAFADFSSRNANNRISIGIVIRRAVEDLDAEDSLLQMMSVAFQRTPDYEPQELGIAFAGMEKRGGEHPLQLLLNCSFFRFAGRTPALNDGLWYQSTPAFRQASLRSEQTGFCRERLFSGYYCASPSEFNRKTQSEPSFLPFFRSRKHLKPKNKTATKSIIRLIPSFYL